MNSPRLTGGSRTRRNVDLLHAAPQSLRLAMAASGQGIFEPGAAMPNPVYSTLDFCRPAEEKKRANHPCAMYGRRPLHRSKIRTRVTILPLAYLLRAAM